MPTPTPIGITRQTGGCFGVAEAASGYHQNREGVFRDQFRFGGDETQGERFRTDPVLAGAIADWQDCIRDAVGIDADTPNTLARQYAFGGPAAADREREIAVADVRCQQATSLEEAFYVARATQLRSELGDDVAAFDDYALFRLETVALARQVLDDRGIAPPSLD